jgi:membrane fusion protein, heavy metal efflux system
MKKIIWIIPIMGLLLNACHSHEGHSHEGHSHEDHSDESHAEDAHLEEEIEALSYTLRTDKTELFVEFDPLLEGEECTFLAHYTELNNFKPILEGIALVNLLQDGKLIQQLKAEKILRDGIFKIESTILKHGTYDLEFILKTALIEDRHIISSVRAHKDKSTIENESSSGGDDITFLKEQAWKIDFAISEVKKKQIYQIVKTSGVLESLPGDERVITAKSSGVVFFNRKTSLVGSEVAKDGILFEIVGSGIGQDNLDVKVKSLKVDYDKALLNYERSKKLVAEKIISKTKFEGIEAAYEKAKIAYQTTINNFGTSGQKVPVPFKGYIKNIMVREGQYIESGTPLAIISKNQKLLIKANVPQSKYSKLINIQSANFKTSYNETVYDIKDFNGKVLSFAKNANVGNGYLPIYFEIDNKGELLGGAFVEVFLKSTPLENAIVIPYSAVMDDYEQKFVYVQTSGEAFEKRFITTGIFDGNEIEVLSGLSEGEVVVSKGAYSIKLASMSSSIPSHTH